MGFILKGEKFSMITIALKDLIFLLQGKQGMKENKFHKIKNIF
jgi:hypothetical protein